MWGESETGGAQEGATPGSSRFRGSGVLAGAQWSLWSCPMVMAGRRGIVVHRGKEDQYEVIGLWVFFAKRAVSVKLLLISFLGQKEIPTLRLLWYRGGVPSCLLLLWRLDCCFSPLCKLFKKRL